MSKPIVIENTILRILVTPPPSVQLTAADVIVAKWKFLNHLSIPADVVAVWVALTPHIHGFHVRSVHQACGQPMVTLLVKSVLAPRYQAICKTIVYNFRHPFPLHTQVANANLGKLLMALHVRTARQAPTHPIPQFNVRVVPLGLMHLVGRQNANCVQVLSTTTDQDAYFAKHRIICSL
jgi:hypothetical protein